MAGMSNVGLRMSSARNDEMGFMLIGSSAVADKTWISPLSGVVVSVAHGAEGINAAH